MNTDLMTGRSQNYGMSSWTCSDCLSKANRSNNFMGRATETKNISYWRSLWHKVLTILGIHVWGKPVDITDDFIIDTGCSYRIYEHKCQNCDLVKISHSA